MRRRARYKMDDKPNDSKWTHNCRRGGNHPFKMDDPAPRRCRSAVDVTLTTAAGHGVPTLIIHRAVGARRPRASVIDAASLPGGSNQEATAAPDPARM